MPLDSRRRVDLRGEVVADLGYRNRSGARDAILRRRAIKFGDREIFRVGQRITTWHGSAGTRTQQEARLGTGTSLRHAIGIRERQQQSGMLGVIRRSHIACVSPRGRARREVAGDLRDELSHAPHRVPIDRRPVQADRIVRRAGAAQRFESQS